MHSKQLAKHPISNSKKIQPCRWLLTEPSTVCLGGPLPPTPPQAGEIKSLHELRSKSVSTEAGLNPPSDTELAQIKRLNGLRLPWQTHLFYLPIQLIEIPPNGLKNAIGIVPLGYKTFCTKVVS